LIIATQVEKQCTRPLRTLPHSLSALEKTLPNVFYEQPLIKTYEK